MQFSNSFIVEYRKKVAVSISQRGRGPTMQAHPDLKTQLYEKSGFNILAMCVLWIKRAISLNYPGYQWDRTTFRDFPVLFSEEPSGGHRPVSVLWQIPVHTFFVSRIKQDEHIYFRYDGAGWTVVD
jgi:hypothetical protein